MPKNLEKDAFYIPVLAVIGVGMIGGSLALALRGGRCVGRVIGAGRSLASLEKARALGVIDAVADSPLAAARAADVVVLAAPVGATAELLRAIAPAVCARTVVTDVGSVKGGVCEAARRALGRRAARFVPGHPVAGKEHSGVGAAHADLFARHNVALTPLPETAADALRTVRRMWRAAGARVIRMDAARHDQVLALTSHLPHVLAYAMVDLFAEVGVGASDTGDTAASDPVADLYRDMAAGGFFDFTRTASSDPAMWRDICLMNRDQLIRRLFSFNHRLSHLSALIGGGDGDGLQRLFENAAKTRAQVAERRAPSGDGDGGGGDGGGGDGDGGGDGGGDACA